jgi:polyribonucleotide nucleotidyltransferase
MFIVHKEEISWGGARLTLETGGIARQADGAVLVTYGETTVLVTTVSEKNPSSDGDFVPLTVHYQERSYAAGRIPGGYFKREGRPAERETLISRLIDRPIRPLFKDNWRCETQILATVLSYDGVHATDIASMIGASAALTLSGVPFLGPLGAARVGYNKAGGEYILNPSPEALLSSDLDLVIAGTENAVLMVESEACELSEDVMLGAVMFGHKHFQPVIEAIIRLAEKAARPPRELIEDDLSDVENAVRDCVEDDLRAAYSITEKQERYAAIQKAWDKVADAFSTETTSCTTKALKSVFKKLQASLMRLSVLDTGVRVDGRDLKSVRPIAIQTAYLPRVHGSALFTRGETQALVVATLGTGDDEQNIDSIEGNTKERFLLHYNFPSYSVGEVGRMASPGRREIGHGKLAWRALRPLLPSAAEFPYTLRVVSEITESNGSSSMATVCGGSLSLMDAGVPLKAPVAGIAMGLILEGERFAVLSDILGDEDHLGDMDFKVAGSKNGITALQMDIKIAGITEDIMRIALDQAYAGRMHILEKMHEALPEVRSSLGAHAPRIESMSIPPSKIREVIGSGGKVIKEIVEKTKAKIDISDDGTIKIASSDAQAIADAMAWITGIIAEPEEGRIYNGTVTKTMDFGAFVRFLGPREGLVHISQLADRRVEHVTDVVKEGDAVKVKVIGFDPRGKVKLSMRVVNQETGANIEQESVKEVL